MSAGARSLFARLGHCAAGALTAGSLVFFTPTSAVATEPAGAPPPPKSLAWDPAWPKFRPAEIAFTAGLSLQVAAALFVYPPPQRNIHGGFLFDDAVRNTLRLHTRSGRSTADLASDVIYVGLGAYPIVVDAGLVAGVIHQAPEVSLQLLAMDLEAYAFTGAIALTTEKIGRVRPEARGCVNGHGYSAACGNERDLNSSFISGHTTLTFTSAGLICAHHEHLPLYGGGAPDTIACATALALASSTGVMRVMSDNHYTTDVLLGMGLGLLGGYGIPTLLHYGADTHQTARHAPRTSFLPTFRTAHSEITAVLAPAVDTRFVGLSLTGVF